MAVGLTGLPQLLPIAGVRLGIASAGIKKSGRRDLVVIALDEGASVAGVFTRNAFRAAPVVIAEENLARNHPRFFLINTGNANAGTGERGYRDAITCCAVLAEQSGCAESEVLPFSTGVIGEPLPIDKIIAAIPLALAGLASDTWADAAHGIMTTDTVPKGTSRALAVGDATVTVTGIAKGAGMIRPDMATMLAYVATDAAITRADLQELLTDAVNQSFNRITIDGDTSTNDACMLIATGASGVAIEKGSAAYRQLASTITSVCQELAQAIVRDGEGATKFISIEVNGGRDEAECNAVAYTIAHSPLVKTAMFASDPNWGRILAAVGRAGVVDLDLDKVVIHLGDVCIVRGGGRADDYTETAGQAAMAGDEITIRIDLSRGAAHSVVWTCDFSYDYVRINAEYRT